MKDWTIEDKQPRGDDFEVIDLKEITRLRKIEKAAQEYCDWIMGKNPLQNMLLSVLWENLRKALQGD